MLYIQAQATRLRYFLMLYMVFNLLVLRLRLIRRRHFYGDTAGLHFNIIGRGGLICIVAR